MYTTERLRGSPLLKRGQTAGLKRGSTLRIQCFRAIRYSNRLHRWLSYGHWSVFSWHTLTAETSVSIWRQVAVLFLAIHQWLQWLSNKTSPRHTKAHPLCAVFWRFYQRAHVVLCVKPRGEMGVSVSCRRTDWESGRQWRRRCRSILTKKPGVLWLA